LSALHPLKSQGGFLSASSGNDIPMKSNALKRILLIIHDSHLARALQVVLSEQGNMVRWERDPTSAIKAIREFQPDAMLTASTSAVFVSSRDSTEIMELARPIDTHQLREFLESRFGN
jgi:PleD family two-component response regulator